MSEEPTTGVLLRVRVHDDDPQMTRIHQRYVEVREKSRSKRGRARRGAESQWLRTVLIAGFDKLYGPGGAFADPAAPPELTTESHKAVEMTARDKTTKVAHSTTEGNNPAGETQVPVVSASSAPAMDFGALIGAGANVVGRTHTTTDKT